MSQSRDMLLFRLAGWEDKRWKLQSQSQLLAGPDKSGIKGEGKMWEWEWEWE